MVESTATGSLAVQRRRESRHEEWREQERLAAMMAGHLDPKTTFWSSLENKPVSRVSGLFQKRRGVRSGLPDVLVIFRQKPIFLELKSHRGVASKVQKAGPSGAAAVRRDVVDGAKRTRCDDGAACRGGAVQEAMDLAAARALGRSVPRPAPTVARAS